MPVEVYPTHYEAIDSETSDLLFKIEMFDEATAHINIKTVVCSESWDEISVSIKDCLVKMGL